MAKNERRVSQLMGPTTATAARARTADGRAQRAGRKGKPSNEAGEETRTQDATNQDERNNPVRVRLASNGWWRGEADWRP
jgi:hypothetical protein